MKKTTLLFMLACMIVFGVNVNSYSQPASRSVGQRAVPKVGRDRRTAKIVTPPEIAVIKNEVLVRQTCPGHIVATMLDDGKVFVGWRIRNQADQIVGEGTFYTERLQKSPTVYYTQGSTQNQRAKAFSDGRVLIATGAGFVVVDEAGKIIKGQTRFDDEEITNVSVTPLSGGKTMLIAYQRVVGPRGDGRYVIVNRSGTIIHGPKIFNNKGKTNYIRAATLSNGLIHLAYNCSGSKTKVIDVFNNTIVGEHTFHFKLIFGIESVVLDNDNILLAYIDQDLKGQCKVIQPSGLKVSGPHRLYNEELHKIRLAKRQDGNICVVFTTKKRQGRCAIVDTNGKVIKGPVPIYDGYKIDLHSFDCVHLRDNMVMIPLAADKIGSDEYTDRIGAYIVVR
ncbi:hypothetical protein ACFL5Z_18010 [Planctomycetota bacterium]